MKKIYKFLKPYWFGVLMMVVLVGFTSIGQLLLPNYMSKIIGEGLYAEYRVLDTDTNTWELLTDGDTCDLTTMPDTCQITQKSDFDIIINYGLIMLGVTLLSSIATVGIAYYSSKVSVGFGRDIRKAIYQKVSEFSLAEAEKFGTSTLITRSTNDVRQVQMHTIMSFRMVLTIPIIFIGGLIMSLMKNAELTAVLLAGIPALAILIIAVFLLVFPLFKSLQKKIDRLTLVGREALNGVRVIRAFGQGEKEVNRFREANNDLTLTSVKAGNIMAFLNPVVNLLFNTVVMAVIYFAYLAIGKGTITDYVGLASVTAVIEYVTQIMFSLIMLTITFINFPRAEVAGKRISEILDTEITIHDTDNSEYDDTEFLGNIRFNAVDFKYADAEKNVLDHISFEAKVGETIAIIGSTGSGKSTIINLLPRLFDVTSGSITIDDVDVRNIKLKKLRSLIGFVPQTASLFTGTIAENIAYGKEDATDEEIENAAEVAQATEFIMEKNEKYASIVDQGGVNYSGGQKQRISIARAIVRKPKIYIFDDSFSALDFKTDANLRKALKKETTKATVIIVAQRIGTIIEADQIIVLQEGRIVGKGKHRELMDSCEVYREIALSQLSLEELG
ncbi:MAG: ABC transporter ATP-binding protein [Candidatus Izemoplasmatales bacterium]|nr:ABC transporter ATP-binding protein [Candidatus Izemoplasmatales bacterium]